MVTPIFCNPGNQRFTVTVPCGENVLITCATHANYQKSYASGFGMSLEANPV